MLLPSAAVLLFLATAVHSATFPCGPSFTPCEGKAFGAKTKEFSLDDESISKIRDEKIDSKKKEALKLVSHERILSAAREAMAEVERTFNRTEKDLLKGISEHSFSPAELSWTKFTRADQYSKYLSYSALVSVVTTQKLAKSAPEKVLEMMPLFPLRGTAVDNTCPVGQIEECVAGKYRSYSGHCNNILNPLQGAVYEPLRRTLPADYADKISLPRVSSFGSSLPSAADVSKLFTPSPRGHASCSLMLAQWAAFLYDDLAHVASNRLVKDGFYSSGTEHLPIPCCSNETRHSECFPIYSTEKGKETCSSYARSMPVPRENCTLGPREQGNMVSSYLDGSQIYGSVTDTVNRLRSFSDGKLQMKSLLGQPARFGLPIGATDAESDCRSKSSSQPCFLAGSHRVNFLPSSSAMYTLWMRQHNLIADKLKAVNPHWNDERLFQEARRFVIAQLQHITYTEFLPSVIGKENMARFGIQPRTHGFDSGYDMSLDASTMNVFASSAGQFFLSLLPDEVVMMNKDGSTGRKDSLSKVFNDPSALYQRGRVEAVLRGLLMSPILKPGLHISPQLKNTFGKAGSAKGGMDLAAMVIQMGRDHGLPGYLEWRRLCKLENVQSFAALAAHFKDSVNVTELSEMYESAEDIDLFVGGLAEKTANGALLGPTLACLFAKQMQRTKRADRFWYENFVFPSAFSDDQLAEIRKSSLARVICDNSDGVDTVQQHVFSLADEYGNCPVSCSSPIIEGPNIAAWKDGEQHRTLPITKETLEKAIRLGLEQYNRLQEAEGRRLASVPTPTFASQSAVFSHAALMAPKRESLDIARTAAVLRETTQVLLSGSGLSDSERLPASLDVPTLQRLLPQINVEAVVGNFTPFLGRDPLPKEQCLPQPLPCDHTTKYRSYSGWCNNLRFPKYGNAFGAMRRLLDPKYDDGFDSPRTRSAVGGELPSARKISNLVHNDSPEFHVKFSHMLMQFGQILDHDMMHSPIARGPNNTILNCSRCDSQETLSIHCFPIRIEKDDPFFPAKHADGSPRCMPFARSLLGQLTLGYRNQLNQLTSFLDASFLYGSTECEANRLRLFSQGKLNFTDLGYNKEALPQGNQERDCRSILKDPKKRCFVAGDERSNEQPGLTVLHTLFLREHNRIASLLNRINNFWTDEQLYQEARRIMIAKIQHVIFKEWLPVVLGCETMAKYGLMPKKNGYFEDYDETCDASISQEMSTSAFRFGHTLIRSHFPRMNDIYANMSDAVSLKDHFSNPTPVYDQNVGHVESLLMGLLGAESMAFDRHITDSVRNHLFAKPGGPLTGIDLPAVNIQRARDHGVPGYNEYRSLAGLRRAKTFDDLRDTMDPSAVAALRAAYVHVDDIDLFPGIMSERPMKGALVGPSLAFIIAEQMQRLKKCDRFYYESGDPMVRFTPDQLAEIKKTTMAKILCANSQYARKIQPNVFLLPDDLANAPMSCSELPDTDLYQWLDRKFCVVDHRVINLGKTKRITPCVSCTCTSEGAECHSMTMERCDRLIEDYAVKDLLKDPVCMIQCASVILANR